MGECISELEPSSLDWKPSSVTEPRGKWVYKSPVGAATMSSVAMETMPMGGED